MRGEGGIYKRGSCGGPRAKRTADRKTWGWVGSTSPAVAEVILPHVFGASTDAIEFWFCWLIGGC